MSRIGARSSVGDTAWKQIAEARFDELTNLTVSIRNEIDSMMRPLHAAAIAHEQRAAAATAAAGTATASVAAAAVPYISYRESDRLQHSIRRRLRQLHERMTALQSSAAEQDSSSDQQFILDRLTKQLTIAEDLQNSFRRAVLTLQIELNRPDNAALRDQLLGGANPNAAASSDGANDPNSAAAVHDKSTALTDALQRARNLLATEINRTNSALQVLQGSTKTMQAVGEKYGEQGSALQSSKNMITKLSRRERTDKYLLYAGVAFFAIVCLYISTKRIGRWVPTSIITYPLSFLWQTFVGGGGVPAAAGGPVLPPAPPDEL